MLRSLVHEQRVEESRIGEEEWSGAWYVFGLMVNSPFANIDPVENDEYWSWNLRSHIVCRANTHCNQSMVISSRFESKVYPVIHPIQIITLPTRATAAFLYVL